MVPICNYGLLKWWTETSYFFSFFQVMLGSGSSIYEDWMRAAESSYRDKFRGWVGFNVPVSHRITAG